MLERTLFNKLLPDPAHLQELKTAVHAHPGVPFPMNFNPRSKAVQLPPLWVVVKVFLRLTLWVKDKILFVDAHPVSHPSVARMRRQAERKGYRSASGQSDRAPAQDGGDPVGQNGCGFPLLGSGESLHEEPVRVFDRARKIDRKTGRLLGEGRPRRDGVPPHTDADLACQFRHQPERWEREYRFVGLRYDQPEPDAADLDQIGLFNGLACLCRLCLT